jgi:hypothetical protein
MSERMIEAAKVVSDAKTETQEEEETRVLVRWMALLVRRIKHSTSCYEYYCHEEYARTEKYKFVCL